MGFWNIYWVFHFGKKKWYHFLFFLPVTAVETHMDVHLCPGDEFEGIWLRKENVLFAAYNILKPSEY